MWNALAGAYRTYSRVLPCRAPLPRHHRHRDLIRTENGEALHGLKLPDSDHIELVGPGSLYAAENERNGTYPWFCSHIDSMLPADLAEGLKALLEVSGVILMPLDNFDNLEIVLVVIVSRGQSAEEGTRGDYGSVERGEDERVVEAWGHRKAERGEDVLGLRAVVYR